MSKGIQIPFLTNLFGYLGYVDFLTQLLNCAHGYQHAGYQALARFL